MIIKNQFDQPKTYFIRYLNFFLNFAVLGLHHLLKMFSFHTISGKFILHPNVLFYCPFLIFLSNSWHVPPKIL